MFCIVSGSKNLDSATYLEENSPPIPLRSGLVPSLYGYKEQNLPVHLLISYADHPKHSKHCFLIAFNGVKETSLVPPSFDLILCLIILPSFQTILP
jgi:hypothetical protein